MNKVKPLTDLEMHELLRLIYPEHIRRPSRARTPHQPQRFGGVK